MLDFLHKILPSGIDIVFLGQPRKVGFLVNFDINQDKKVALHVNYVGIKPPHWTGYWFDVKDFSPPLDAFNPRQYGGLLVCYKSLDGKSTMLPLELKLRSERENKLRKMIEIYQRHLVELLSVIEKQHITDARVKDTIEHAKQLKSLKNIVAEPVIRVKKDDSPFSKMIQK